MTQFNPHNHLLNLESNSNKPERWYLPVQYRLVWLRDQCPQATIETEMIHLDLDREVQAEAWAWNTEKRKNEKVIKTAKGFCIFRAVVKDGKGGIATGTKSESAVNFSDFIEKAESGSIGRALAALGFGTQFCGDELEEQERIVDSPVDRSSQEKAAQTTKDALTPAFHQLVEAGILDDSEQGWRKFCKLIVGWLQLANIKSSQQLLETLTASQVEMVKNHVVAEVQKAA